jgi:choline dehydrogenase-like flavoprotein
MGALSADIVVIGSGMGGGTVAHALAQRGADVLVLERGERIPREPENWSPHAVFVERRYKPAERWLDGGGRPFAPGVHYVVGGSTKVYGASLPRLREQDFGALEHREGTSPAWPFSYADVEPYYAEAEHMYRVHGEFGDDPTAPPRSGPFPFPAVEHEPYIAELADRLRAQGVHPAATSMGIDLRPGGACVRSPTCDGFPCMRGAKSDAETCGVDPALATGNARLETGVRVRRIVTDGGGRRVQRLMAEGRDGAVDVRGGKFVLAAGAVNSAALLLASADEKHPDGLANGSGQVGRNFMMHNNAHIVAVDLDRRNDVVFQKTLGVNDFYLDGGDGFPLGSLQLIGKVQGVMMKTAAPRGVPLALLDQVAKRSVEWLVMAEDLPSPENRVIVDSAGRITTARTARGMSTHARLLKRAKQILRDAGYDAILTQHFDISMNSHQCGTVVAGRDPATSVLDPWCRAHELENLWVVDGGFFPSSAATNPALTIAAQALRVVAESDLGR